MRESRTFFILNVVILSILFVQGWTGDFVNLFAVFPSVQFPATPGGFLTGLAGAGAMEVYHAAEGAALFVTAVALAVMVFRKPHRRSVRIWALIGLFAVASAAYGGISFVLSGFKDDGSSAQMGGAFLGAFASFFLVLYFDKKSKTAP